MNFAPRVRIPVLMINGAHDSVFPPETEQEPMYELLGTPTKERAVYETGHAMIGFHNQSTKKILEWLDRHLGPV